MASHEKTGDDCQRLTAITVLHGDDDPDFTDAVGDWLERENARIGVRTAATADAGLELLAGTRSTASSPSTTRPGGPISTFSAVSARTTPDLPCIL